MSERLPNLSAGIHVSLTAYYERDNHFQRSSPSSRAPTCVAATRAQEGPSSRVGVAG